MNVLVYCSFDVVVVFLNDFDYFVGVFDVVLSVGYGGGDFV